MQKTSGSRSYPVEYTYDSQGRMKTMKTWQNFSGNSGTAITTWDYDAQRGWLASKDYADATTGNAGTTGNDYLYSDAGRLRTNQLARIVSGSDRLQRVYSYGNGGDLSGIAYNDGGLTPGVTFTYDRLGRRLTAARGSTTSTFSYTTASLPLGESHAGGTLGGWAVTNTFDGNLRRATLAATYSGAAQFTQGYGYDTAGRLQTATSGSFSAEYGYHANSPLVSTVSHRYGGNNRMVTTKQYDFINRLSSIANGAYDSYAYGYNAANQRTNVVRADGSYWVYAYDNLGQVISGKRYWSDGTPVAGQQHEYVFDDIGNRTSAKSGGNSSGTGLRTENYTRNRLNQYTQKDEANTFDVLGLANVSATVTVNGSSAYRKNEYFHKEVSVSNGSAPVWQSVSTIASLGGSTTTNTGNMYVAKTPEVLTYDLDGNQLTDGRWSNTWDAENRLILQETIGTVPTGAKKRLIYEYDWMGRRIRKQVYDWVGSEWSLVKDERFLYDGWNVIAILNSATTIQQTQLWGQDLSGSLQGAGGVGGLLALTHYPSSKTYFTGYDGNGNVTVLMDGVSGLTEGNFEYGPFGELIRASGTAAAVCPWRFSTKYEDAETGLLYYGYRFYNPSTGRWLSRDPIEEGDGPNVYAFVFNSPKNMVDRNGRESWGMSGPGWSFQYQNGQWRYTSTQPTPTQVAQRLMSHFISGGGGDLYLDLDPNDPLIRELFANGLAGGYGNMLKALQAKVCEAFSKGREGGRVDFEDSEANAQVTGSGLDLFLSRAHFRLSAKWRMAGCHYVCIESIEHEFWDEIALKDHIREWPEGWNKEWWPDTFALGAIVSLPPLNIPYHLGAFQEYVVSFKWSTEGSCFACE